MGTASSAAGPDRTAGPERTAGPDRRAAHGADDDPVSFDFAFGGTVGAVARRLGVRPDTSEVVVDGDHLRVRLGRWRLATPLTNVAAGQLTGPYRAWRVVGGPRLSLADRGVTLATSTGPGLCIRFWTPVRGLWPLGPVVHHPGVTVTVRDVEGLLAVLARRSG